MLFDFDDLDFFQDQFRLPIYTLTRDKPVCLSCYLGLAFFDLFNPFVEVFTGLCQ